MFEIFSGFLDRAPVASESLPSSDEDVGEGEGSLSRRLQQFFEDAQDSYIFFDEAGRCIGANPAASQLTGYDREELLARHVADLIPDIAGTATPPPGESAQQSVSITLRRKDGIAIPVRHRLLAGVEPGVHLLRLHHVLTLGERRGIGARLVATDAPAERPTNIVIRFDRNMTPHCMNPSIRALIEEGEEPPACESWKKLYLLCQGNIPEIFRAQQERVIELDIPGEEGTRSFQVHFVPELDQDGAVAQVICIVQEITERKQAEIELLRIRKAIESTSDIIGIANSSGKIIYRNHALKELLEWDGEAFPEGESPATFVDQMVKARAIDTVMRGQSWSDEVDLRTRRGRIVTVNLRVDAIRDERGRIMGLIGVGTDITERKRAEVQLADIRRSLTESLEAERLRLAQYLHDDSIQQLLGLSYQLLEMQQHACDERWTPHQRVEELIPGIEVVWREIINVVHHLRGVIGELRPPGLKELGLVAALREYFALLEVEHGARSPAFHLDLPQDEINLPDSITICLFRVTQEAVRNIIKHARASRATVELHVDRREARLEVADDGAGFELPPSLATLSSRKHFGLIGMQERVVAVGGRLSIFTALGAGTRCVVQIPLPDTEVDDD